MEPINKFEGKYRFLSNFYPCFPDGLSVEHRYQAAKAISFFDWYWVLSSPNAGIAKKRGRQIEVRKDWEQVKLNIMEQLLNHKFLNNPDLKKLLLDTGERELIEGNWWGDTFWGVCNGIGENHLGKLLMKVRKELRNTFPR